MLKYSLIHGMLLTIHGIVTSMRDVCLFCFKFVSLFCFKFFDFMMENMFCSDVKGNSHQERLESFYISQADLYDSYRHRMLHGRFPMIENMPAPKGGVWVDMGGGTGSNLEFFGEHLDHWSKVRHFLFQNRVCLLFIFFFWILLTLYSCWYIFPL